MNIVKLSFSIFTTFLWLVTASLSGGEETKTSPESKPDAAAPAGEKEAEKPLPIPTTLAEAHTSLEQQLPKEELDKIDAMSSADEMIIYHLDLGMGIRNAWGLWKGGPLAKHLLELGFKHPDDMSSLILETFWCKRHGKDFQLKERAEASKAYWKKNAEEPEPQPEPDKDK